MKKALTLCRYTGLVEPVWNYLPKARSWAYHSVMLHNKNIVDQGGDLDKEFWYLREQIGAKTHIISMTAGNEFIKDDPAILAKVLPGRDKLPNSGSANSRKIPGDFNKHSGST